jgi:uncharacterized membrane protein YfcA
MWHVYLLITIAGLLQGFINTMAGSGTVVMYSLLSAFGMPVNLINGTVRPGILFQTGTSSIKYYRNNKLALKKGLVLGIPMILGSIAGAELAISINKEAFEKIVAFVLLLMLFFMFYNPKKWLEGQSAERQAKTGVFQILLFLGIGFYGGFIHIGVGIFLLSALVLNAGFDLVQANALKVFLVFMYAPVVLIIFLINGQVDLLVALFAAVGNIIGGLIGANMVIKRGSGFVKVFLIIIIIVFSFHLLGIWNWIYQLFV